MLVEGLVKPIQNRVLVTPSNKQCVAYFRGKRESRSGALSPMQLMRQIPTKRTFATRGQAKEVEISEAI